MNAKLSRAHAICRVLDVIGPAIDELGMSEDDLAVFLDEVERKAWGTHAEKARKEGASTC